MLDWMIEPVPSIQKGQRIHDKCRKTSANLPQILEMKQLSLQVQNTI
jgi:hypothetical protein